MSKKNPKAKRESYCLILESGFEFSEKEMQMIILIAEKCKHVGPLMPGARAHNFIFIVEQLGFGTNYEWMEETFLALQKKFVKIYDDESRLSAGLVSDPELFHRKGLYHISVNEKLVPEFKAVAQFNEDLNGFAFILKKSSQRALYRHFMKRDVNGGLMRCDKRDKSFTSTVDLCDNILKLGDKYKRPDGSRLWGEITRCILGPDIEFLLEKTDLDIGKLETVREKRPGQRGGGFPIEGFYTTAKTIKGRKASAVVIPECSYYQLWDKLGLSEAEIRRIVEYLSPAQQDEALTHIHQNYQGHDKAGFSRKHLTERFPDLFPKPEIKKLIPSWDRTVNNDGVMINRITGEKIEI